ncbi:hypothetical protein ED733_006687 [Metarhizium rileyi]|uniref:DUF3752 domain-containing protein n=1 Tax=Metarhizium rileyi (strain RCEF 4871) TaxID=1649241 RepID=A0A5C6GEA4_METRR|nr:hypothetical protein ED733_006687 [Metarhizium rileyi]
MSQIGPQPPSPKRRRSASPPLSPSKQARLSPSSSSSSDDYGPSLPTATTKRPVIGPSQPSPDTPQRDAWMIAPPTSSGYRERDPTRMRNRKFASKPSAAPTSSSIWTETPDEKLKRQRDALLGRTKEHNSAGPSARDEERRRNVAEAIEAQRGRSLYDEHADKRRVEGVAAADDDDPSQRAFDRDKDMALGGKIGDKARRELINKSANFGDRFQKGSFL